MNKAITKPLVLLVDDNISNIKLLVRVLRDENVEISVANSGKDAIAITKKELPDIILLDIMMPELDGFEVCKILKDDLETKDIPIIFLTALDDINSVTKGFEVGGVDYIKKPFLIPEVLQRLHTHIELKRSRERSQQEVIMKNKLIHLLGHDLSNPLENLKMSLNLLKGRPEHFDRFWDICQRSVNQCINLLNIISEILRVEDPKKEINLSTYNLLELANETKDLIFNKLMQKDISLNIDIDPSIFVCVEKTTFVQSVLANLLTNSIKFSKHGAKIEFSVIEHKNKKVTFSIRDQGIGIPQELQKEIFNINGNSHQTMIDGKRGTGLSLPLVKSFIDTYNGEILLKTSKETGSEFIITLDSFSVPIEGELSM